MTPLAPRAQRPSKKQLEKREKEVLWFTRKYLGLNEQNFALLVKHLSPEDVSRMLKVGLKNGMTLTWEQEP